MKTSNKLITALAALFFLVPLIGMVYESKDYVDAKNYKFKPETPKSFNDNLEGHTSQALDAFTAINVADARGVRIALTYIKDAKYGVKVRDNNKDYVSFKVNAGGVLEVTLANKSISRNYIEVVIYAPAINNIMIANADGLDIPGSYDSLNLTLTNVKDFNLREGNTYKTLTINAADMPDFSIWNAEINVLNLTLKNTKFQSNGTSYKALSINTTGWADVDMEQAEKERTTIDNLTLNTSGRGTISLLNVDIKQLSGSLSDSTTVNMPIGYLRQMLSSKN